MCDDAKALAQMLDRLCQQGSGHINVTAGGEDTLMQTVNSADICKGNMACSIPTLHEGIDGEE